MKFIIAIQKCSLPIGKEGEYFLKYVCVSCLDILYLMLDSTVLVCFDFCG